MAKTPILIIAPFFAPQSHAAMFRVHKLVKYLPEYGYKPIIITTDINYNYNEDLSLLDELPPEVEIHRVKYVEPTMRGLRMLLGGQDRTFKTMKKSLKTNNIPLHTDYNDKKQKRSFVRKIYSNIQHFLLNMPDAHWTWIYPATKKAKELIKEQDIKLFYTTANPNSVLKIGLNIKDKFFIKWVADFRDPIGYGERYNTTNHLIIKTEQQWIKDTMIRADILTGLSSSYKEIFEDLYNISKDKYVFIPTGLDEKYIDDSKFIDKSKYLLFIGEFQTKYDDYIFKIISKALEHSLINEKFKIKFIGRKEVNEPLVTNLLKPYSSLKNIYEFIDHIPQAELYSKIQNAYGCILISGGDNFWWCNFAKMVDYIALNKNVLAHVANPSEARKELSKSNLGIFLENNESKDIKMFSRFMNENNNIKSTNYCKNYLASTQVKEFSKIFDKLLKKCNEQ